VPTITDFNNFLNKNPVKACYCFPEKEQRLYFTDKIFNKISILNVLNIAWSLNNLPTQVNLSETPAIYYEFTTRNEIYRLTYSLSGGFGEEDNIYVSRPTEETLKTLFKNASINYCGTTCIPSLYYDVFLYKSVSTDSQEQLKSSIVDSWLAQNVKSINKNLVKIKIIEINSNWKAEDGTQLTRVLYLIGLSDKNLLRALSSSSNNTFSIKDYQDPNDSVYNQFIGSISPVYHRQDESSVKPLGNPLIQTVNTWQWWMTLIIVIAGLLLIAIFIIAVFGIASKRKQNNSHYLNASNYNEPYQAYPETSSNQNQFSNLRLNLTQADNTTR